VVDHWTSEVGRVVLTYLLVQGTVPDVARHERTLGALRTVILHDAALQRDVLRARTGLLRSYDPLVRSIENMRQASASLDAAGDVASGEARAAIDRRIDEMIAAVHDQEALVEAFKSDNALLQNSLAYFNYLSSRLAAAGDSLRAIAPAEVGAVTTAMLRFMGEPRPDAAREVTAALDHLARQPTLLTRDVRSLAAHGRLIVATLPTVDEFVVRLQGGSTGEIARALQDVYLDAHGRAAARASVYQTLLYAAALALVAYAVHLFVRLRANAAVLRQRLGFEALIASISTQFINLPRDRVRADIRQGLARLVDHADLDCAQIVACRGDEADIFRELVLPRLGKHRPALVRGGARARLALVARKLRTPRLHLRSRRCCVASKPGEGLAAGAAGSLLALRTHVVHRRAAGISWSRNHVRQEVLAGGRHRAVPHGSRDLRQCHRT
jgi:hypothetical protein